MIPRLMLPVYAAIEKKLRDIGFLAGKSGRHMKYPYTISAKISQFPIFYYMKHNFIWTYYPPGFFFGWYLISYIHVTVNSDSNKRNWAETQRRMAEAEAHGH